MSIQWKLMLQDQVCFIAILKVFYNNNLFDGSSRKAHD